MLSHCIIKVLLGGKKPTCLDLHSWCEFITVTGWQEKKGSPSSCFSNQISRPKAVLRVSPETFSCPIRGRSPLLPFLVTLLFRLFLCFHLYPFLVFLFLPPGFCLLMISTFSWSCLLISVSLLNSFTLWSFSNWVGESMPILLWPY